MGHFTRKTFGFLRDLAENNDRDWFQANKGRYEEEVKEPALEFIRDFSEPLKALSPHFKADPRANGGSLFRIYRDTRFSKDKSPYKTFTGIQFRHDLGKDAHTPGFYLHSNLASVSSALGSGTPMGKPSGKSARDWWRMRKGGREPSRERSSEADWNSPGTV